MSKTSSKSDSIHKTNIKNENVPPDDKDSLRRSDAPLKEEEEKPPKSPWCAECFKRKKKKKEPKEDKPNIVKRICCRKSRQSSNLKQTDQERGKKKSKKKKKNKKGTPSDTDSSEMVQQKQPVITDEYTKEKRYEKSKTEKDYEVHTKNGTIIRDGTIGRDGTITRDGTIGRDGTFSREGSSRSGTISRDGTEIRERIYKYQDSIPDKRFSSQMEKFDRRDFTKTCCYLCAKNTLAIAAVVSRKTEMSDKIIQANCITSFDKCGTSKKHKYKKTKSKKKDVGVPCTSKKRTKRSKPKSKRKKFSIFPKFRRTKCPIRKRTKIKCVTEENAKRGYCY